MARNTYILGRDRWRVVGATVVVKTLDGSETYVVRDAWLPINADPGHIEHLLERGLVEKVVR